MTWRKVTTYSWICDLCGHETTAYDDLVPTGWVCDQVGHHRCPSCVRVPCGCDDGMCRAGL